MGAGCITARTVSGHIARNALIRVLFLVSCRLFCVHLGRAAQVLLHPQLKILCIVHRQSSNLVRMVFQKLFVCHQISKIYDFRVGFLHPSNSIDLCYRSSEFFFEL